jgi:phosphoglycerate dehydrogenase-like enzyme
MRVAVLDDYQGVAPRLADWGSLGPDVEVRFHSDRVADPDALVARLADVDAVVLMRERTPFPREVFERLPRLALLVTPGMRNAAVDLPAARDTGVVVSGTPGSVGSTAELTWALVLALVRHVPAEDAALRAGRWQTTVGVDLAGRTLGVLGLGKLGRRVARVGHAFDMQVIAWSQNLTVEAAAEVGVERVERDELFRRADVLTVHVVLSDRTRGLVGAAELGLMKPTAYLVNTSRGPVVDTDALVAALTEGRLAGAGLDVFDTEPLPADAAVRRAPNTVLTPHLGFVTEDVLREWYAGAVEDIAAFRAGAPIRVLEPAG